MGTSLKKIVEDATELSGSKDAALFWVVSQQIPGWGGKTAIRLILEGKSDAVLAYLASVRAGVYS
jgi:hypothetical protein